MLITILVFLIIISLIVFFHELGHFLTARKSGVRVEEFGFGFPPRIFSIKKKETIYSINLIPLGGFVKIKGESGENRDEPDSFLSKPFWKKFIILASGVGMNVVLAYLLISLGLMIGLPTMLDDESSLSQNISQEKIQIASVYKQSAADLAGLKTGDAILSVNNEVFTKVTGLQEYLNKHQDEVINLELSRGREKFYKEVTQNPIAEFGNQRYLGVSLIKTGIIKYGFFEALYQGFISTVSIIWQIVVALFLLIKNLFYGVSVTDQLAGPVGVVVLTSQVTQLGLIYILQFTALLSLNLSIINILPFPALDGGRILFAFIEKVRGKPNNDKIESIVHNLGFSLLILLMVFVTYKDLLKYGQQILNNIKGVF